MSYSGQLNQNIIQNQIFNMIISQHIYSDDIKGTNGDLLDQCRVDGSMYGDTKLYYSSDALRTWHFRDDAEAANLLRLHRPKAPEVQAITLNVFRQIRVTVDSYLSKQGFTDENTFAAYNARVLGWLRDTKRVADSTMFNTFIGNTIATGTDQSINVNVTAAVGAKTGEEANRLAASEIAKEVANLYVELSDVNRKYNDYHHIRSYSKDDLIFVFNSAIVNEIEKKDLPTIFHKDGLFEDLTRHVLPSKYFGSAPDTTATTGNLAKLVTANYLTVASGVYTVAKAGKLRAKFEQDLKKGTGSSSEFISESDVITGLEAGTFTENDLIHLFAGEEYPVGAKLDSSEAAEMAACYVEDGDIICKVMHRNSVPFMSGFDVGTMFNNPRSLTDTHFVTYGYNTLAYLQNYPFITMKKI